MLVSRSSCTSPFLPRPVSQDCLTHIVSEQQLENLYKAARVAIRTTERTTTLDRAAVFDFALAAVAASRLNLDSVQSHYNTPVMTVSAAWIVVSDARILVFIVALVIRLVCATALFTA